MVKKFTLLSLLFCSIIGYTQVYQLPNGGFEQWETVTYNNTSGEEPLHWNSFITASGSLASMGANQIYVSTDIRPGSTGIKSIKTTARDVIFGIIANGTFTTGQINMGSITMTDPANHNITRTALADFNQPFNGQPDSIVFWAKFVCPSSTQQARISAIIHDNYDYMDPDAYDVNAPSHKVGQAALNFTTGAGEWTRYAVSFDYNFPASSAEYILISFTTNIVAGGGSVNDDLYVDDIEFIYNTNLADLKVDNITITGFNAGVLNYSYSAACDISLVPQVSATAVSPNATVNITQATLSNPIASVMVTSGDQTKTYEVSFSFPVSTSSQLIAEICQGESYSLNGFSIPVQNTSGIFNFQRVIQNVQGCDSTIILALTVNPKYDYSTSISICESQLPFQFGGQIFNEAGTYNINLQTIKDCDSLITLILTVGDEYTEILNPSICEGESFTFMGTTYSETGVYTQTIISPEGCDSIYTINLTVNPNYEIELMDTVMIGWAYTQNGFNLPIQTTVGTFNYQLNLSTVSGCDSIIYLSLTVLNNESINEFGLSETIRLYPNPAKDFISIKSPKSANQIDFYNITGALVKRVTIVENSISVQDLESGIYIIRIVTDQGVAMKKLIIR